MSQKNSNDLVIAGQPITQEELEEAGVTVNVNQEQVLKLITSKVEEKIQAAINEKRAEIMRARNQIQEAAKNFVDKNKTLNNAKKAYKDFVGKDPEVTFMVDGAYYQGEGYFLTIGPHIRLHYMNDDDIVSIHADNYERRVFTVQGSHYTHNLDTGKTTISKNEAVFSRRYRGSEIPKDIQKALDHGGKLSVELRQLKQQLRDLPKLREQAELTLVQNVLSSTDSGQKLLDLCSELIGEYDPQKALSDGTGATRAKGKDSGSSKGTKR